MVPASCYCFADENRNRQGAFIKLYILGFDRPSFTHEVLKAVTNDDLARIHAVQIESNGLLSEGYLQLQVVSPKVIPLLIQRLKKIAGLVRV